MAAVYSIRIAGDQFTTLSGATIFTVPVGKVWILRDINVWALSASAVTNVAIYGGGGGHIYVVTAFPNIPGNSAAHWEGRTVFNSGEGCRMNASGGGGSYSISGYELDAG